DCVAVGSDTGRHSVYRPTGQPATPCRSARPRTGLDADRYRRLLLQFAVERRLGEKSACRLQDLVGPPQLTVLLLQCLETFTFFCRDTVTRAAVDLHSLDPVQQGGRCAAYLGRNRLDGCPQRPVLVTMLLNQTHRTLTHFRGKFVVFAHGSILSRIGASSRPGVIQVAVMTS